MSRRSSLLFINFTPAGQDPEPKAASARRGNPDFSGNQAKEFYESIVSSTCTLPPAKSTENKDDGCSAAFSRAKKECREAARQRRKAEKRATEIPQSVSASDLLSSCQNGDLDVVEKALRSCAWHVGNSGDGRVLDALHAQDTFAWTPLMCASFAGHSKIVAAILDFCDTHCTQQSSSSLSSSPSLICTTLTWWNVVDRKGRNACDLTEVAGHTEVESILDCHADRHSAGQDEEMTSWEESGAGLSGYSAPPGPAAAGSRQCPVHGEGHAVTGDAATAAGGVVRCDLCRVELCSSHRSQHRASTVHRLNVHELDKHQPPTLYTVPAHNPGYQLMLRDGWDPEKGLGSRQDGRKLPIKTHLKRSRAGLGCESGKQSVDGKGKRITHFGANDTDSVRRVTAHHAPVRLARTKKEMARRVERERRKEIAWRRELSHGSL